MPGAHGRRHLTIMTARRGGDRAQGLLLFVSEAGGTLASVAAMRGCQGRRRARRVDLALSLRESEDRVVAPQDFLEHFDIYLVDVAVGARGERPRHPGCLASDHVLRLQPERAEGHV